MNSLTVGGKRLSNQVAPSVDPRIRKMLKGIGGLTDFGDDYLRLVWGQSELVHAYGEMRMKYLAASAIVRAGWRTDFTTGLQEPVLERVDIGKPRWYIEEWWPPSLLKKDWDEEVFGAFPERGKWRHFLTLESPSGGYRHPDMEAMEWVRECWQKRQEARELYDWHEDPPDEVVAEEIKRGFMESAESYEKRKQKLEDRFKSLLQPHIKRLMHAHPNEGTLGIYRRAKKEENQ